MAKRNKMILPQSTAGLIRYFEESEESIKLRPEHIVFITILIIILEFILQV